MTLLIAGLVLLLGTHGVSMARELRGGLIARYGEGAYKGLYSIVSLLGLGLIIYGFGQYRAGGYIEIWTPPKAMRHITLALMFPAMITLAVYILPMGRLKAVLRHPMLVTLKIWAITHLMSNGDLGSIVLFGAVLAYAVINRISMKSRSAAPVEPPPWGEHDTFSIGFGIVLYVLFVYFLHALLIGVPVFPGM